MFFGFSVGVFALLVFSPYIVTPPSFEDASPELGFYDVSPAGESGGKIIPASYDSGIAPPPPPTLTISPGIVNIVRHETVQFTAMYDPDGPWPQYAVDVTSLASWTSDDTNIAIVNVGGAPGLAQGKSPGITFINATYSGISVSSPAFVTVRESFLQRIREILPRF